MKSSLPSSKSTLLFGGVLAAVALLFFVVSSPPEDPTEPPSQVESLTFEPIRIAKPDQEEITSALRPSLARGLGLIEKATPSEKLSLIYEMPGDLSEIENQAVLSSLLAPRSKDVSAGWHAEFLHSLCLLLQRSLPDADLFCRALLTLAYDTTRPLVVRDYAIQHLTQFYASPIATGHRAMIVSAILSLAEPGSEISATALLAAHLLGPEGHLNPSAPPSEPVIPDGEFTSILTSVLASPAARTSNSMTAFRIIADRRLDHYRPELRQIIADERAPALVRASALGTLSSLENPEDKQFIEALPSSNHPLFAQAVSHAQAALK